MVAIPLHIAGPSAITSQRHCGSTCWLKVVMWTCGECWRYQAQEQSWGLDGGGVAEWKPKQVSATPACTHLGHCGNSHIAGAVSLGAGTPRIHDSKSGFLIASRHSVLGGAQRMLMGILLPWETVLNKLS